MTPSGSITIRIDPRDVRIIHKLAQLAALVAASDPALIPDDVRQCALDAEALLTEEYGR